MTIQILSSSLQFYNRDFDIDANNLKVPVFLMQRMSDSQIKEFLKKNGEKVQEQIINEITTNDRLKKIVQVPLMLYMLIAVVEKEKKIPDNKAHIIRDFLQSLYKRERREKDVNFDIENFHLLLCHLGFETRTLADTNSALSRGEFINPILEEGKKKLGLNLTIQNFLTRATDLNIIVKDKEQYSFAHESYQEYYAAEYLKLNN
ncbi:NACHT domain-containing protein [Candidatus Riflebacteria bacterium]